MLESTKKVLVIDDNASNLIMINGVLKDTYKVYSVNSGDMALKFLARQIPDLILLDVEMPVMSGYDLIKIIKSDHTTMNVPVIFLTALNDAGSEAYAFKLGAVDYIRKPLNSVIVKARVKFHLELQTYRNDLQTLVDLKTSQIELMQKITIDLLAHLNEYRDSDTGDHTKRTANYVTVIMDNIPKYAPDSYEIPKPYYDDIKKSTPLHDIGKISISDSILLKPGPLTNEEFEIMKTHVSSGAVLLQDAIKEFNGPSFLDAALEIVQTHHEKWNGTGYPRGLEGEQIPISGRIMAIADVYDALTSKRPYKPPFPHEKAVEIIRCDSGKHFDPILVDLFLSIQGDIKEIAASDRTQKEKAR